MRFIRSKQLRWLFAGLLVCAPLILATSADQAGAGLPKPETTGGKPLMEALTERHSTRAFSDKTLSPQTLSNLLWAAFGVNRPDSGKRTAPSAFGAHEIDIYVATADGLFLFDPKAHALITVTEENVLSLTGRGRAPVNLIYVADHARMARVKKSDEEKLFFSAANTGCVAQNVYLFCASEGLGTVIRNNVGDWGALSEIIGLRPEQKFILTQPVGYPKQ